MSVGREQAVVLRLKGVLRLPHLHVLFMAFLAVISLVTISLAGGCGASIPAGRYGVRSLRVEGLHRLSSESIEACLATRSRPRWGVGPGSDPVCNEPPFDSAPLLVRLFDWPWTEWPLFDASIFERDQQRVLRWMHARGHYDATVDAVAVVPEAALGHDEAGGFCRTDGHCEADITFTVTEGEPVLVERFELHIEDDALPEDLRLALRSAVPFRHGVIFDEAVFDEARRAMIRVLADRSYIDARVTGMVKVDAAQHQAFVAYDVVPGQRAVVGRICVRGTQSLPAQPVLGATYLVPGQSFSLAALEEAQRAIYGLGTFASVEIRHRSEDVPDSRTETAGEGEVDITATSVVPNPAPVVSADAETEPAAEPPAESDEPVLCIEPREAAPAGVRVVALDVVVQPGRLERFSVGVGLQSGSALQFSSSGASSVSSTLSSNQWDLHVLGSWEHRNVFDSMLRLRIEERPRLIFPNQFPQAEANGIGPSLGNQVGLSVRWPAFLEPRTVLVGGLVHDYGPAPLLNFPRHELDGRVGLERSFFDGKLALAGAIRGNLFLPVGQGTAEELQPTSEREATRALWLEQSVVIDLRDDPRRTRAGFYAAASVQVGGLGGLSSWDFLRVSGEVRGYVPLPLGWVIAGRFGMAGMEVFNAYGLDPDNIYQLATLGPLSQQLTGGGPSGNRGYSVGFLGDVSRRAIVSMAGTTTSRTIVSGGVRRWDASLELRVPLLSWFGVVAFADAGDVSKTAEFRFNALQLSLGFGLRFYAAGLGTLRLDAALRPDFGTSIGPDPRQAPCADAASSECRPESNLFGLPGAAHLTLEEAF